MLVSFCNLKPNEKILDIGCGCGRIAIPLTRYLNHEGSYYGFDISKKCVDWDIKNISAKYPNFKFERSDIHNKNYNPKGKLKASEYKFPYGDNFFDLVFLSSIFTHLLPADMENYLSEIARVLKHGGRCFITYYLINEESQALSRSLPNSFQFNDSGQNYYTQNMLNPETAIAYKEEMIRALHEKYNLSIKEIHYGNWCGRKKAVGGQDVIIATKPEMA